MPDFPIVEGQLIHTVGLSLNAGALTGLLVTSGDSHNFGGYATIIESTPHNTKALMATLLSPANSATIFVRVAYGESFQNVVAPLLPISGGNGAHHAISTFWVPAEIPRGVKLGVACQADSINLTVRAILGLAANGWISPSQNAIIQPYGHSYGGTNGVIIDPGGTANVKSAWMPFTEACSQAIKGFYLAVLNSNVTARSAAVWSVDLAIGPVGEEQILLEGFPLSSNANIDYLVPSLSPYIPTDIPRGTRISARASCSVNTATARLCELMFLGVS